METVTPTKEERMAAGLARLSPIVGLVLPFANCYAPLFACLLMPDSSFVRNHAISEARYQAVWTVICFALFFVVTVIATLTCGLGAVLYLPVLLLVVPPMLWWVTAAAAAFNGSEYRYPITD